ncbi:ras-like GTP-binding protein RHO [Hydra vulgaris]|uniref:ras-like GTP-binding protein RHO n=1 Tax=Hydra vulgaris TaxID=6087 RepID=UPI0006411450|nr:ras-like GTP-binding protein RHO [Hydra vulgaris]XP_047138079.1 ras-like GTP-binding protein RHO [Hydra vulgaris]
MHINSNKNQMKSSERSPVHRKKLVIVGDGACGKTSLLYVFTKDIMPAGYVPTIFDNYVADMEVDNKQVELALFDTAGQEEYDQLRILMYPNTDVVIICYSIDNPDSLINVLQKWTPEVKHYCPGVPIILCGNKKDLRNNDDLKRDLEDINKKPLTLEEGLLASEKIDAKGFIECSALTKAGVMSLFETAARHSMKKKITKYKQIKQICSII